MPRFPSPAAWFFSPAVLLPGQDGYTFLVCFSMFAAPMLDMLRQYVSGYVALTNAEFTFLAEKLVVRSCWIQAVEN